MSTHTHFRSPLPFNYVAYREFWRGTTGKNIHFDEGAKTIFSVPYITYVDNIKDEVSTITRVVDRKFPHLKTTWEEYPKFFYEIDAAHSYLMANCEQYAANQFNAQQKLRKLFKKYPDGYLYIA